MVLKKASAEYLSRQHWYMIIFQVVTFFLKSQSSVWSIIDEKWSRVELDSKLICWIEHINTLFGDNVPFTTKRRAARTIKPEMFYGLDIFIFTGKESDRYSPAAWILTALCSSSETQYKPPINRFGFVFLLHKHSQRAFQWTHFPTQIKTDAQRMNDVHL